MFSFFTASPALLRDARTDDAERFAEIHATGFDRGWAEDEFERLLAERTCVAHVAATAGVNPAPVGFVLSRRVADEAEILAIVILPADRRSGVGRALLGHHLGRLAALGVRTLFLEVAEDNAPARRLYDAAGFVEVGRRTAYYARPGEAATALVLRRRLD